MADATVKIVELLGGVLPSEDTQELGNEEIAARLGEQTGAIKSGLYRAREVVRAYMLKPTWTGRSVSRGAIRTREDPNRIDRGQWRGAGCTSRIKIKQDEQVKFVSHTSREESEEAGDDCGIRSRLLKKSIRVKRTHGVCGLTINLPRSGIWGPRDFFVAVTAKFRLLYVFVVIEHGSRRLVHVNVTVHPSAA